MTDVLVVDDSRFIRSVVGDALTDAGYEVTTATSGADALDLLEELDPAVITMDVKMPGMSGLEAVDAIMESNPTPILMLSAYTPRGAEATLAALRRGAVDYLKKPDGSGTRNIAHLADEVVEKVDRLATADVSSLAVAYTSSTVNSIGEGTGSTETVAARTGGAAGELAPPSIATDAYVDDPTVIIGASTGGPTVLEQIFQQFPADLGAKVVVVQHMPAAFTERFADRLDAISEYHVREARDGDRVGAGEALVAPGDFHLEITANFGGFLRVELSEDAPIHGVKPAIDVTMESAADVVEDPLCGVVLTGMGKDGAQGITAIKQAGGTTIAQDEPSSPIFGIPRAAIETGCVDEVVSNRDIVDSILDAFRLGELQ